MIAIQRENEALKAELAHIRECAPEGRDRATTVGEVRLCDSCLLNGFIRRSGTASLSPRTTAAPTPFPQVEIDATPAEIDVMR